MLHSDMRMLLLGAVVIVGAGTVVAFVAAERGAEPAPVADAPPPVTSAVAQSYKELRGTRRGPNAGMYQDVAVGLSGQLPPADEAVQLSDEGWAAAIAGRRGRRAYDGAPPTVPHAVTQQTQDCTACHAMGAVVGDKTAPMRSHPLYPSCTQCHVPMEDPRPEAVHGVPPLTENGFVGLEGPRRGERAWPGAPPTIPHSTRMREECTSCHGPSGKFALRTPHLDRRSCTQCHAPSALLDQRPKWMQERTP